MTTQFQGLSVGIRSVAIPPYRRIRQTYVNDCDIVASATQYTFGTAIQFNLNSTFAPGGGAGRAHQPLLRDTLAAQYTRYRVRAVAWEIDFVCVSGTDAFCVAVRLVQPGDASTIGAATEAVVLEKSQTWSHILVPNSSTVMAKFRGSFPLHTLLGLTTQEYEANVEDYAALVGASPARLLGLEVAATNINAGTATPVRGIGRLTFEVDYFQPTPIAQS
jgi:hypothetical protein